jgi:hypothetical protein
MIRRPKNMKLSTLFTKAAQWMDMQDSYTVGMCLAVNYASPDERSRAAAHAILNQHGLDAYRVGPYMAYWGLNLVEEEEMYAYHYPTVGRFTRLGKRQANERRVMFLLLIAAQLKAEGL